MILVASGARFANNDGVSGGGIAWIFVRGKEFSTGRGGLGYLQDSCSEKEQREQQVIGVSTRSPGAFIDHGSGLSMRNQCVGDNVLL